jgi:hypothetical protein
VSAVVYIAFAHMDALDKAPAAYMRFFSSIMLIAILTFVWPALLGLISYGIEHFSVFLASLPWGIGGTYEEQQANAAKTLLFGYKQIREVLNINAGCMTPQDVDNDGTVDGYTPDIGCYLANLNPFTGGASNLFTMPFIVFFGNAIGLLLGVSAFIMASIRLLLVHVLSLGFTFILAFSRMPVVGKFFDEWLDAFYGLLLAPIFIAIAATAGPIAINDILHGLVASGADGDAIKITAFILWAAHDLTPIAILVASAKFLGPIFSGTAPIITGAFLNAASSVGGAIKSGITGLAGMHSSGAADAAGRAFSLGLGGGGNLGGSGSVASLLAGGGSGAAGVSAAAAKSVHPTLSNTIATIAAGSIASLAHGTMHTAATVMPSAIHSGHSVIKATDSLPGLMSAGSGGSGQGAPINVQNIQNQQAQPSGVQLASQPSPTTIVKKYSIFNM